MFSSEDIEYQQAARFMIVSAGRTRTWSEDEIMYDLWLSEKIMTLTKGEIIDFIHTEYHKGLAKLLVLSRVDRAAQHLRQQAEQALATEPQPEPPTAQTRTS